MSIRMRDLLYAVALGIVTALVMLLLITRPVGAQVLSLLPPPVEAGGAMVVTWNGITSPTPTDWIGLYAPGSNDDHFIDFIYVHCSNFRETRAHPQASGTCGFVIPGDLLPGPYELRLFAADGYTRLSTSPKFQILNGGQ